MLTAVQLKLLFVYCLKSWGSSTTSLARVSALYCLCVLHVSGPDPDLSPGRTTAQTKSYRSKLFIYYVDVCQILVGRPLSFGANIRSDPHFAKILVNRSSPVTYVERVSHHVNT
jgi:hypothetical protein